MSNPTITVQHKMREFRVFLPLDPDFDARGERFDRFALELQRHDIGCTEYAHIGHTAQWGPEPGRTFVILHPIASDAHADQIAAYLARAAADAIAPDAGAGEEEIWVYDATAGRLTVRRDD